MTTEAPPPRWAREIVLLNAIAFVAFGAAFLLLPGTLAPMLDIELATSTAFADVRAIYGGLPLAVGLFFALGLRRPAWFAPSLFLVAACCGELALARLYSVLVSGVPGATILVFLALEAACAVWAALAYRAVTGNVAASRAAARVTHTA